MNVINKLILSLVGCGLVFHSLPALGAETNQWPSFQEVYEVVRAHLAGASDADLNRAAVQGFLSQLRLQASLVSAGSEPAFASDLPVLGKSKVFDEAYGYVRVGRVGSGLAEQIMAALKPLQSTNKLKGLILDLRFTDGLDYAAAAAAADRFVPTEQPLLSWGETTARSSAKTNALNLPVTVLVNQETAGAAEALAALLRQTDVALLIGSTTAGRATLFKEFPLRNGQRIRIATATVRLGNGQPLPLRGLVPDIQVAVNPEDERAYLANPYRIIAKGPPLFKEGDLLGGVSATNRTPRPRINEAELVRMQKEGQNPNEESSPPPAPSSEGLKPTVQDPALTRALDLLKGLAVVNRLRQS